MVPAPAAVCRKAKRQVHELCERVHEKLLDQLKSQANAWAERDSYGSRWTVEQVSYARIHPQYTSC